MSKKKKKNMGNALVAAQLAPIAANAIANKQEAKQQAQNALNPQITIAPSDGLSALELMAKREEQKRKRKLILLAVGAGLLAISGVIIASEISKQGKKKAEWDKELASKADSAELAQAVELAMILKKNWNETDMGKIAVGLMPLLFMVTAFLGSTKERTEKVLAVGKNITNLTLVAQLYKGLTKSELSADISERCAPGTYTSFVAGVQEAKTKEASGYAPPVIVQPTKPDVVVTQTKDAGKIVVTTDNTTAYSIGKGLIFEKSRDKISTLPTGVFIGYTTGNVMIYDNFGTGDDEMIEVICSVKNYRFLHGSMKKMLLIGLGIMIDGASWASYSAKESKLENKSFRFWVKKDTVSFFNDFGSGYLKAVGESSINNTLQHTAVSKLSGIHNDLGQLSQIAIL